MWPGVAGGRGKGGIKRNNSEIQQNVPQPTPPNLFNKQVGTYPVAFLLRYSRSQYCSLLPSSATGAPGGGLPSQRESTGPACFWPPAQPQGLPVSILAVVWPLGSPAILVFCVLVSTHSGPGLLSPEGQERATKPSHLLSPPPSLPKSLSVLPERGLSCPKQTLGLSA